MTIALKNLEWQMFAILLLAVCALQISCGFAAAQERRALSRGAFVADRPVMAGDRFQNRETRAAPAPGQARSTGSKQLKNSTVSASDRFSKSDNEPRQLFSSSAAIGSNTLSGLRKKGAACVKRMMLMQRFKGRRKLVESRCAQRR